MSGDAGRRDSSLEGCEHRIHLTGAIGLPELLPFRQLVFAIDGFGRVSEGVFLAITAVVAALGTVSFDPALSQASGPGQSIALRLRAAR